MGDCGYKIASTTSRRSVSRGRPKRLPWLWGRRTPVTAQHFLTYRDKQASTADSTYWVPVVPHPILMLQVRAG
jgi:hypothetical protein